MIKSLKTIIIPLTIFFILFFFITITDSFNPSPASVISVKLRADKEDTYTIYYDSGNGYRDEASSQYFNYVTNEFTEIRFEPFINFLKDTKSVKIHLGNHNKRIFIKDISIITPYMYRWSGSELIKSMQVQSGVANYSLGNGVICIESLGKEFWFELPLDINRIKHIQNKNIKYYLYPFAFFLSIISFIFIRKMELSKKHWFYILKKHNILLYFLIMLPILFFIVAGMKYHIEVPIADEFDVIFPRIQHFLEGNLSFQNDILSNQNVHNSLFPLLTIMLLAKSANWDLTYEYAIGSLLYIVMFLVLSYQVLKTAEEIKIDGINWLIPIISMLIFSMSQFEILGMGFLFLQFSMLMLSTVAGIIIMSKNQLSLFCICAGIIFGIIATFSHGAGVIFWPIGLFIIFFQPQERKTRLIKCILWICATIMIAMIYLMNVKDSLPNIVFSNDIINHLRFIFIFLGTPIASTNINGALYTGIIGLILMGCFISMLRYTYKIRLQTLIPYISLSFFSILNAILISLGRYDFVGELMPLWRDQRIIATPFWISFTLLGYMLAYLIINKTNKIKNTFIKDLYSNLLLFTSTTLFCLGIIFYSSSYYLGYQRMKQHYADLCPVHEELLRFKDGRDLNVSVFNRLGIVPFYIPDKIIEGASFLKDYRLTVFREGYEKNL